VYSSLVSHNKVVGRSIVEALVVNGKLYPEDASADIPNVWKAISVFSYLLPARVCNSIVSTK